MMVGRLLSFWEGNFSGVMLNFRWVYKKEAAGVPKKPGSSALRTVIVRNLCFQERPHSTTLHIIFFVTQILALQAGENPKTEIDSPKQNAIAMARKLYTDFLFSFVQFLQVQKQTKHPTKNRNKNIKKNSISPYLRLFLATHHRVFVSVPYPNAASTHHVNSPSTQPAVPSDRPSSRPDEVGKPEKQVQVS